MKIKDLYILDFSNKKSKEQLATLINSESSPTVIEFINDRGEKQYLIKEENTNSYHIVSEKVYEEYKNNKDKELLEGSNTITEKDLVSILTPNITIEDNQPALSNESYLEELVPTEEEQEDVQESLLGDFLADIILLTKVYKSVLDMRLGIDPCLNALEYTKPSFPGELLAEGECSSAKISKPNYSTITSSISATNSIAINIESKIDELVDILNNQIETFKTENNEASELLDAFLMSIARDTLEEYIEAEDMETIVENLDILPEEYVQYLVGQMDQEQYNEFITGVKNYYTKEVESLISIRDICITILDDINLFPVDKGFANGILSGEDSYYNQFGYNLIMAGLEISTEDLEIIATYTEEQKLDYLNKLVAEHYGEKYEITTYAELIALKQSMEARKIGAENGINVNYHKKESAEYDYLYFFKVFNDYTMPRADDLEKIGFSYSSSTSGKNIKVYDYQKYHEQHPDISEIDYLLMIKSSNVNQEVKVVGLNEINNANLTNILSDLNDISLASQYNAIYSKTYSYLYKEDPTKANKYYSAIQYQINDIKGQVEANKFLQLLGEKDNSKDALDFLWNGLAVKVEGTGDGIDTFFDGLTYAVESVFTLANGNENRTLSVDEYKKRYVAQALMSQKDKETLGLIKKNEDGQYTLATEYNIIDYTKEYAGFVLKNQYELFEGIGNMLPSVLLSSINPLAGSTALAISSGGNTYHNAMIEGDSYARSLLYGIASGSTEAITEKFLGGLPFLSDVKVTDFITYGKSMFKEGMEEFYQDFIDMAFENMILGKEIELPKTKDEWLEAANNRKNTFLYGFFTAGIMQSPSLVNLVKSVIKYNEDTFLETSPFGIGKTHYEGDILVYENMREWHNAVKNSKYQKEIRGIIFSASSQKGLEELIKLYEDTRKNKSFAERVFFDLQLAKTKYITDIGHASPGEKLAGGFSISLFKTIFINNQNSEVLTHEGEHQLDDIARKGKIRKKTLDIVKPYLVSKKAASNTSGVIMQVLLEEKYRTFAREYDKEAYPKYYREGERRSIKCLWDIYDALTRGQLNENEGKFGHGKKYYKDNGDLLIGAEIIAQVSAIVGAGHTDLLYNYLPKDLVTKLIDVFYDGFWNESVFDKPMSEKINKLKDNEFSRTEIQKALQEFVNGDMDKLIYFHPVAIERYFNERISEDPSIVQQLRDATNHVGKMKNSTDQFYLEIAGDELIFNYLISNNML